MKRGTEVPTTDWLVPNSQFSPTVRLKTVMKASQRSQSWLNFTMTIFIVSTLKPNPDVKHQLTAIVWQTLRKLSKTFLLEGDVALFRIPLSAKKLDQY